MTLTFIVVDGYRKALETGRKAREELEMR